MTRPNGKTSGVRVLAGDIGGTHTRLGIFAFRQGRLSREHQGTFYNRDAKAFETLLEDFLKAVDKAAVSSVCLGVAGPVKDGRCTVTNLPWVLDAGRLADVSGGSQVRLVNDLSALAYAVPLLDPADTVSLNPGERESGAPLVVIAPGTGTGVALSVARNGRYEPMPSEGGHMDFAPASEEQSRLWLHLHRRFGHVSMERLVSGPGLVAIYEWLGDGRETGMPAWLRSRMAAGDPARAISEAALARKDDCSVKALDIFISILGAMAGSLALIALPRAGVYLGGGIPPKILPKLKTGGFMRAFSDKGRFREVLMEMPVDVITADNAALAGAAVAALADAGIGIDRVPPLAEIFPK